MKLSMRVSRAKLVTFSAVAAGLVVLAVALVEKNRILEQWYLPRIGRGDMEENTRVLKMLGEVGGEAAIIRLINYQTELWQAELAVREKLGTTASPSKKSSREINADSAFAAERRIGERAGLLYYRTLARYVSDSSKDAQARTICANRIIYQDRLSPEPIPNERLAAISACLDLLAGDSARLSKDAATVLGFCDPEEAHLVVPTLEEAAREHPCEAVRQAAREAIKEIRAAGGRAAR